MTAFPTTTPAAPPGERSPAPFRREVVLALLLAGACLATYAHACGNGFAYDDRDYVTENFHVRAGLSLANAWWALTSFQAANWHPLTWLSLQLDASLFGPRPWGYHLHNLLLHAANTALLFLFLRRATGALWRSALAAALFSLHPLHVESVAWVAERKDVLSVFFGLLALLAYLGYTRRPGLGRYLLVALAFALSLLAKPMLVTLPCVLLLLDYWPLGRLRAAGWEREPLDEATSPPLPAARLVLEKLPLFLLTALSCVLTWLAQSQGGAVVAMERLPFWVRAGNALVSYVVYLRKTLWPTDLAAHYPLAFEGFTPAVYVGAALLLAALTAAAVLLRRRAPYLLVGWLWYLGTLVPVIGLVQVGVQALADRYTYLPLIGIFVALSWGLGDLVRRWRCRSVVVGLAAAALAACVVLTWLQVGYWYDNASLWARVLAVNPENSSACYDLGYIANREGRLHDARKLYQDAIRFDPTNSRAHCNLGMVEMELGNLEAAEHQFSEALRLQPEHPRNQGNLATAELRLGKLDMAAKHFQEALRLNPGDASLHYNLGVVKLGQGAEAEAGREFAEAVRLNPRDPAARHNLGRILAGEGQLEKAAEQLSAALELLPDSMRVGVSLAEVYERQGKIAEATALYRDALRKPAEDPALPETIRARLRQYEAGGS